MVGGLITVNYRPNGPGVVAASAGDYVYPSDVRINQAETHLFVKARGLAGGIRHETWLFDYDLEGQRLLKKTLVDSAVLPEECTLASSSTR